MPEDKDLRRARDRFGAPKTQTAMRDAVLSITNLTVFDAERIITQVGERLGEFKSIPHFKHFRAEVVAWVTRQALLTAEIRGMLHDIVEAAASVPECRDTAHIAAMLMLRLPEYEGSLEGDPDTLKRWAVETAKREAQGVVALTGWITEHRKAVYAGIWDVLRGCLDLNIAGVDDDLAARTWWYVANHATQFLDSAVPLHVRLRELGYWFAREWKTSYLNAMKKAKLTTVDDWQELEERQAYYEEQRKCPPRPIVLGPGDDGANDPPQLGLGDLADYDKPMGYEDTEDDAELLPAAA